MLRQITLFIMRWALLYPAITMIFIIFWLSALLMVSPFSMYETESNQKSDWQAALWLATDGKEGVPPSLPVNSDDEYLREMRREKALEIIRKHIFSQEEAYLKEDQ